MTVSIISVFLAGVAIGMAITNIAWIDHNERTRREALYARANEWETIRKLCQEVTTMQSERKQ